MNSLLKDYRKGLEEYIELHESNEQLSTVGRAMASDDMLSLAIADVAGNESLSLALGTAGSGIFSFSKWVGGNTINLLGSSLKGAGKFLSRTFDSNRVYIRKLGMSLNEDDYTLSIPAGTVSLLTRDGDFETFEEDLDTLLDTLNLIDAHSKQVLDYLNRTLSVARQYKTVKSNKDVMSITDKLMDITYPELKLPRRESNGVSLSEVLPGNRVIKFSKNKDDDTVSYSMFGDKPTAETYEADFGKSHVKRILDKLDKLNRVHKSIEKQYEDYFSFLRSWSDMVKSVDDRFSNTDGLSRHIVSEAEQQLKGDVDALSFYSGLLPRVVNYVARYIHGVFGFLTKI